MGISIVTTAIPGVPVVDGARVVAGIVHRKRQLYST